MSTVQNSRLELQTLSLAISPHALILPLYFLHCGCHPKHALLHVINMSCHYQCVLGGTAN